MTKLKNHYESKYNQIKKYYYIHIMNDLINKNIDNLFSQINDSFNNCYMVYNNENEIKKFINNIINNITNEEDYKKIRFEKMKSFILKKSETDNIVQHLNIVLVGKTGVGKTTLINSVLNYDEKDYLKTGIGKPITMGEPKYYLSKKVPLLRLADSRGIEMKKYGIKELRKSINKYIKDKLESGNPDEFVHCIWYCISGVRLEDIEMDTLNELRKIYQSNSIPIIIVYTRAVNDEDVESMKKFIKDNYKSKDDFVPVLARKEVIKGRYVIEPFGIDELKNISVLRAKKAVNTTFYEDYINQIKSKVKNKLDRLEMKLNSYIRKTVENKLKIMEVGKSNEEIYEDLKNLLFNLLSNYIYNSTDNKPRSFISLKSENFLYEFSKKVIQAPMNEFNEKFNHYIIDQSVEISININDKKKYDINYYEIIEIVKYFIDKNKKSLYQTAWLSYIKNYIKNICTLFANELKDYSEKIYNNITQQENFKLIIKDLIKKNFDKIKEKLHL